MATKLTGASLLTLLVLTLVGSISTHISYEQYMSVSGKESLEEFPPINLDPFGRYTLSWEVDRASQTVTFNVIVKTNGYVGFGISNEGTMAGADIVVAEFNANGRITFQDYHGVGHSTPQLDIIQNWILETYQRNGTHTMLVFTRPYDTGDTQGDVIIKDGAEETYFVWAISQDESPVLEYHGSAAEGARGSYRINILYPGVTPPPTTTESTTVTYLPSSTTDAYEPTTTAEPGFTFSTTDPWFSTTGSSVETTTFLPGTNVTCDFQDILVHPFPPPCYVEFLCNNLAESVILNSCGFINLDPRLKAERSKKMAKDLVRIAPITCDFQDILVHPLPAPCRVEFICSNIEEVEVIHVNNCGFIDF